VTQRMIEYLDFCWAEEKLTSRDFAWTDDLAVNLSEQHFREFALPYNKQLRFHFDGWLLLHMCGKADHLLKIFVDELKIHEFQGYGYQVDLDKVAAIMGGKVVLTGNVNPMLIHAGTPEMVREATRRVIEKLGPYGGVIIQDGSNIPPGTPIANINAMTEAAEIFGRLG
jgi:uroporphyrinogen-III decarboxylase